MTQEGGPPEREPIFGRWDNEQRAQAAAKAAAKKPDEAAHVPGEPVSETPTTGDTGESERKPLWHTPLEPQQAEGGPTDIESPGETGKGSARGEVVEDVLPTGTEVARREPGRGGLEVIETSVPTVIAVRTRSFGAAATGKFLWATPLRRKVTIATPVVVAVATLGLTGVIPIWGQGSGERDGTNTPSYRPLATWPRQEPTSVEYAKAVRIKVAKERRAERARSEARRDARREEQSRNAASPAVRTDTQPEPIRNTGNDTNPPAVASPRESQPSSAGRSETSSSNKNKSKPLGDINLNDQPDREVREMPNGDTCIDADPACSTGGASPADIPSTGGARPTDALPSGGAPVVTP